MLTNLPSTLRPRFTWRAFGLLVPLVLACGLVVAGLELGASGQSTPETVQAESEHPALPPGQAALRATIDPETGTVGVSTGPTALPLDPDTKEALRRDTDGLVQEYHPDGSVTVHLQGRFQSASVARIGEDGKLVICTDEADGVERAVREPVATSPEVK